MWDNISAILLFLQASQVLKKAITQMKTTCQAHRYPARYLFHRRKGMSWVHPAKQWVLPSQKQTVLYVSFALSPLTSVSRISHLYYIVYNTTPVSDDPTISAAICTNLLYFASTQNRCFPSSAE